MRRFLKTLEDEQTPRSIEEYLGAFTESFKMILHENPVERMGHAVMLAAKTALRLKSAKIQLKEHEIAALLQTVARNVRLTSIINDLTPEEKKILSFYKTNESHTSSSIQALALKSGIQVTSKKKKNKGVPRKRA